MSITSKRGDDGQTDLMFGRRVPKTDSRVKACGEIDELSAAIGMARVTTVQESVREILRDIQEELIVAMGELMTLEEDRERYFREGHQPVSGAMVDVLSAQVVQLEEESKLRFKDWVRPGEKKSITSVQLDLARTICRRAERAVAEVMEKERLTNLEVLRYLNRLSDVLWLLARKEEASMSMGEGEGGEGMV